jgi:MPBQ/MSBQ methyltransferase
MNPFAPNSFFGFWRRRWAYGMPRFPQGWAGVSGWDWGALASRPVDPVTRLEREVPIELAKKSNSCTQASPALIVQSYDTSMFEEPIEELYNHSDFANWGYWLHNSQTQKEACEGLMEKLLSMIPEKGKTVLDVACGKGATTRHLTRYYRPQNVSAINLSRKQLQRAKMNAPGCRFLVMSATELKFESESFDTVISVEAAFHFITRRKFLAEAWRVLRPGGWLVLSDILFHPDVEKTGPMLHADNWIESPVAYRDLLVASDFEEVRILDATDECAHSFEWHLLSYMLRKYRAGEIDWKTFAGFMSRRRSMRMAVRFYVLAAGRKPKTKQISPNLLSHARARG